MKCIGQGFVIEGVGRRPQCAVVECDLNVASDIKTTPILQLTGHNNNDPGLWLHTDQGHKYQPRVPAI